MHEKTIKECPERCESTPDSYLLEVLKYELELISAAILDRNRQSTQIKQWCLTLWMASWIVVKFINFDEKFIDLKSYVYLIPCIPPLIFVWVEILNKRIERKFTFRSRLIHEFLNYDCDFSEIEQKIRREISPAGLMMRLNGSGFRFFDPSGMNTLRHSAVSEPNSKYWLKIREDMNEWISFKHIVTHSYGLFTFYILLLVIPIVTCAIISII